MKYFAAILMICICSGLWAQGTQPKNKPAQEKQINYLDINGQKQGYWHKKDAAGKSLFEGTFKNDKPVGIFKRFHPNGTVRAEMVYDLKIAEKCSAKLYDVTGELAAEGCYLKKDKIGEWKYYGQGAKLLATETYVKGVKEGPAKVYFDNGKPSEEVWYKNGQRSGTWIWYYQSGKTRMKGNWANGTYDGQFAVYYETGVTYFTGTYKGGLKEGEWKFYDDKGALTKTYFYRGGQANNQEELDKKETEEINKLEQNKGQFTEPNSKGGGAQGGMDGY